MTKGKYLFENKYPGENSAAYIATLSGGGRLVVVPEALGGVNVLRWFPVVEGVLPNVSVLYKRYEDCSWRCCSGYPNLRVDKKENGITMSVYKDGVEMRAFFPKALSQETLEEFVRAVEAGEAATIWNEP